MEKHVKRMVEEHKELVARIYALNEWVYGEKGQFDDKVEFANKAIQLSAMKKYEECLRARLENSGIVLGPVCNIYYEEIKISDKTEEKHE